MEPLAMLQVEGKRFVAGGPLLALREWLEGYDEPISSSPDQHFRRLASDVWALISEGDLGELSEREIRNELGARHPDLRPTRPATATRNSN